MIMYNFSYDAHMHLSNCTVLKIDFHVNSACKQIGAGEGRMGWVLSLALTFHLSLPNFFLHFSTSVKLCKFLGILGKKGQATCKVDFVHTIDVGQAAERFSASPSAITDGFEGAGWISERDRRRQHSFNMVHVSGVRSEQQNIRRYVTTCVTDSNSLL